MLFIFIRKNTPATGKNFGKESGLFPPKRKFQQIQGFLSQ
jgi:hypothetical protein